VGTLPSASGELSLVEQACHGFDEGVGVATRLAAGIGDPLDRGSAAVEGAQDLQHPGTALGVQFPGQAYDPVGSRADPQLPHRVGFLGGFGAIRVEVGQQALRDGAQR